MTLSIHIFSRLVKYLSGAKKSVGDNSVISHDLLLWIGPRTDWSLVNLAPYSPEK